MSNECGQSDPEEELFGEVMSSSIPVDDSTSSSSSSSSSDWSVEEGTLAVECLLREDSLFEDDSSHEDTTLRQFYAERATFNPLPSSERQVPPPSPQLGDSHPSLSSSDMEQFGVSPNKSKFLDLFTFSKGKPYNKTSNKEPKGVDELSFTRPSGVSPGDEASTLNLADSETNDESASQTGSTGRKGKQRLSTSFLLNMISSSYKTRANEFRKLFASHIPSEERLIAEFSCALNRDFLLQGRMYISKNYFCFYSNIFFMERVVVMKCEKVKSLSKAFTAGFIPNAIEVTMEGGERHLFSSFIQRDKTLSLMCLVWSRCGGTYHCVEDEEESSVEGSITNSPLTNNEVYRLICEHYGENLGLMSHEELELQCNETRPHSHTVSQMESDTRPLDTPSFLLTTAAAAETVGSDVQLSGPNSTPPATLSSTSSSESLSVHSCRCHSHSGLFLLEQDLPISCDTLFELLFERDHFFRCLYESRGTFDYQTSEYSASVSGLVVPLPAGHDRVHRSRRVDYTIQVNIPLVKSAIAHELQCVLQCDRGRSYTVLSQVRNEGVPYADSFAVCLTWCVTSLSAKMCRLRVTAYVVFLKNTWSLSVMKSSIEKNSVNGLQPFLHDIVSHLLSGRFCRLHQVHPRDLDRLSVHSGLLLETRTSPLPSSPASGLLSQIGSFLLRLPSYLVPPTLGDSILGIAILLLLFILALNLLVLDTISDIETQLKQISSQLNLAEY